MKNRIAGQHYLIWVLILILFQGSNLLSHPVFHIDALDIHSIDRSPPRWKKVSDEANTVEDLRIYPRVNRIHTLRETYHCVDSASVTMMDGVLGQCTYTYDSFGKMTSYLRLDRYGTIWENSLRETYTYDQNGLKISEVYEEGIQAGTAWAFTGMETYTYDENGNLTSELYEEWDGNAWINEELDLLTYDSTGYLIVYEVQGWDGTAWVSWVLFTITNNEEGYPISELLEVWDGTVWEIWSRSTYTYDTNGSISVVLHEGWDGTAWENGERETFTYDSHDNLTVYLVELWDGTAWENVERETSTYDSNDNLTSRLYEDWFGINWQNYELESYSYDIDGNLISFEFGSWHDGSWMSWDGYLIFTDQLGNYYLIRGSRVDLYYITITTDTEEEIKVSSFSLSQNYPNPFNPTTTIRYELPTPSDVTLTVYDISGRTITTLKDTHQLAGHYDVLWNGTDNSGNRVSTGVYFCRLQAGDYSKTIKLVYLR